MIYIFATIYILLLGVIAWNGRREKCRCSIGCGSQKPGKIVSPSSRDSYKEFLKGIEDDELPL